MLKVSRNQHGNSFAAFSAKYLLSGNLRICWCASSALCYERNPHSIALVLGIYATQIQDTGATWFGLHIMWDMFIHLAFTLSLFGASQVKVVGKGRISGHS